MSTVDCISEGYSPVDQLDTHRRSCSHTFPMSDLQPIWNAVETYQGEGVKHFDLPFYRVQFYKGAMEIPLVAFFPKNPSPLSSGRMEEFQQLLSGMGLELECVEEENNYKINTSDTKLYMGRMTGEALKLHAPRIAEKGLEAFSKIVNFYFSFHGGTE